MFKEIRDLRPMSLSVLIMTLIASWMLTLSLGITIVGAQASDTEAGEQFSSLGGLQIALTCISIFMCLPSVVKLAIRRDSRRIALWQVIGASPASAKARYTGIASISALVGAVLGGIFAYLTWPSFTDLVKNTGLLALPSLSDPLTVWAWTFGPGTAFLVLLLSLVLGARSITRIEPVVALSEAPEKAPANSVTKIIFSVLIVAGIIVGYIAIGKTHPIGQAQPIYDSEKLSGIVSAYWGTGLGLLLAYGLSDRIIIQPVVRLIGAILPLNFLDSWLLAKTSARRRSVVSTSVITPISGGGISCGLHFRNGKPNEKCDNRFGSKRSRSSGQPHKPNYSCLWCPRYRCSFRRRASCVSHKRMEKTRYCSPPNTRSNHYLYPLGSSIRMSHLFCCRCRNLHSDPRN